MVRSFLPPLSPPSYFYDRLMLTLKSSFFVLSRLRDDGFESRVSEWYET
jgi:hypothetical protein